MTELFDFLKTQDGGTLFWYGVFIIVLVSAIFDGIAKIIKQSKKSKKESKADDEII
jgi:hypothetical protein